MTDPAIPPGLFISAFGAATLLPLQSKAVLAGLLLPGGYPAWLLVAVAATGMFWARS